MAPNCPEICRRVMSYTRGSVLFRAALGMCEFKQHGCLYLCSDAVQLYNNYIIKSNIYFNKNSYQIIQYQYLPKLISQTLSQPPNLRNTNHQFWNSNLNYISVYISAVTFNMTAEISTFLSTKNHPNGTWTVCKASDCSTDWSKDVNN